MTRGIAAVLALACLTAGCVRADSASSRVLIEAVPSGGFQPQAQVDAQGVVHLAYLSGDPAAADVWYVRRAPDGKYSAPIRINSQPGSAVAIGTVRGVQLALGREGRLHVVWNGSAQAQPRAGKAMPLLYSSFDAAAQRFSVQRNLSTWSGGLDGGGAIAADDKGGVYAVWHANPHHQNDAERAVYLARSFDDGATFAREERISADKIGACACCSMRAVVDRHGTLAIVYRAAGADVNRDAMLLWSTDRGATFATRLVDPWRLEACPLSSFALAASPGGLLAAWETQGQIRHAVLSPASAAAPTIADAPGAGQRKHPSLAVSPRGDYLLAWLEGSGWARGGRVAWQIYGADGRPLSDHGMAGEVPAWGLTATVPLPDGRFLLLR